MQEEIQIPEQESAPEPARTRTSVKPEAARKEAVKKPEKVKRQEKLSDRPMPNEILIINLRAKGEPLTVIVYCRV